MPRHISCYPRYRTYSLLMGVCLMLMVSLSPVASAATPVPGTVPADATSPAAASKAFGAKTFTLDNGMQVILIENHRTPAVTHMVWYKVGAMDEPLAKSGLAHFLEHLMFKGTDSIAEGEFSKIIARHGGQDNAFTSWDFTAYYQKIAASQLPMVMAMEADRMQNLKLSEKAFRTEKQVILEERRSVVENNPSRLFGEQLNATLFLNHPYRLPIIGWTHEIEALGYHDVLEFYKRYYTPNNAILVVTGDVTEAQLRTLARETYGKIPSRPVTRAPQLAEPALATRRRVEMTSRKVQVPLWKLAFVAPGVSNAPESRVLALQVAAQVLGGSEASRLYRELVVEKQLATNIAVSYDSDRRGPAVFDVAVVPVDDTPATLDRIAETVTAALHRLTREPVSAAELSRAKANLQAAAVYANDSLMQPAMVMGQTAVIGQSLDSAEYWPERIGRVSAADIQQAAAALFDLNAAVTGLLLPEKSEGGSL
jgi:zinc protease